MENKHGKERNTTIMRFPLKLDIYIIKKFLGTFFFSLLLILSIAIIFDFSEKFDDFVEHNAPLKAIVVDYYLNFIPYFAVLFSSMFVFISVLFFTSKMAYDTEIIAILSSGVSFRRLLWPYMFSALVIALFSYYLTNYVIPNATKSRLKFEDMYYHNSQVYFDDINIHKQIRPGIYIYMESYSNLSEIGRRFSMEEYENGKIKSKIFADYIRWDSTINKWSIRNYYQRILTDSNELIIKGDVLDTAIALDPSEFKQRDNIIETFTTPSLKKEIQRKKLAGDSSVEALQIELYKRTAMPFSTFILTVIALCVSSRKIRGGIGMHIGLGLLIVFSYILFMQFSSQFAIGGTLPPLLAVWLPNIVYSGIALLLYYKAPK